MAVAAAPSGRSLLGKIAMSLSGRAQSRRSGPSRAAVFLAQVRDHAGTFAALGAFDLGAFQVHIPHLGSAPGWVALAAAVLVAEFKVRG